MNADYLVELFRSVKDGTINLVDSLSVFSALAELNNESLTEAEFFSQALRILLENRDVECCGLFVKEKKHLQLVCHAGWGSSSVNVKYFIDDDISFALGEGYVGKAAETGDIVYHQCKQLPDFLNQLEKEQPNSCDVIGVEMSPGSLMCVPLINHGKVYGVVCLYHSKIDYFNATHEHFFSLFSQFLVQMILNNRYVQELEAQLQLKENQLNEAMQRASALQKDVKNLALIDHQTGLPNRQFFCVESQAALARSNRHGRDFSCCLLEICQFKNLIDEQGLFAGDTMLEVVADILKLQVREGDILAYLRGEQFILALPEVGADGARQFAERMLKVMSDAMREVDELALLELRVGLSTNNAVLSENSQTAMEEMMYQADRALQASKYKQQDICHFNEIDSAVPS